MRQPNVSRMLTKCKKTFFKPFRLLHLVKKKKNNAQISQTPAFEQMAQLLARADRWLQTHDFQNFVLKWKSDEWGDNPAGAAKAEQ